MLLSMLPVEVREANRSEMEVRLWNGSLISFRSADRPDNLRGEGVSRLVVDEAAYVKAETWQAALRPTLSDTNGRALLTSTFRGTNWFYDAYQLGQSDAEEWESWRLPTSQNPYIPASEIDEARRTLPEAVFEQEYMANPLVFEGAVFSGSLVQAALDRGATYRSDLPSFAGLDFGYTNPTALLVCQEDAEGRVSWIDERLWTATELNVRCEAIALECERYGIRQIAADAAGATEIHTLADTLKRRGLSTTITPVPFGRYKTTGIDTRRWYLENDAESIGGKCKTFADDSKKYRYDEKGRSMEKVVKEDDHTVDAATAFYATRAGRMVRG